MRKSGNLEKEKKGKKGKKFKNNPRGGRATFSPCTPLALPDILDSCPTEKPPPLSFPPLRDVSPMRLAPRVAEKSTATAAVWRSRQCGRGGNAPPLSNLPSTGQHNGECGGADEARERQGVQGEVFPGHGWRPDAGWN